MAETGEVDTALGWQWGRSIPGEGGARGKMGDDTLAARRASARVHTPPELHAGQIIKGRPVGTGSPDTSALPSIRACSSIKAKTCLATPGTGW